MSTADESDQAWSPHFSLLLDTPDTRRYLELMHFAGGDLSPAASALELAERCRDADEIDMAGFLVDAAVVAYCRAFVPSKVRSTLDRHIEIPSAFVDIHERIRAYRNTTVAHSQSELSTTWPLVVTTSEEPGRRCIWTPTISQWLPPDVTDEFVRLVHAVLEKVEVLAEALRIRLEDEIQDVELAAPKPLDFELERNFSARTTRRGFPTRQRVFVTRHITAASDDRDLPESIAAID
ncbi:hypothetical protein BCL57_001547 [Agromyces flavus]|uniref:Uncharacterized protein n=1 Tax=Agromyces flavus TaxID=589382 RepID=A0A1H2A218_9MICO|nr:hypothetical protein [Agromyces flavus]MCP2367393.1 hypothetical protein [Agromyces flavus]GGI45814.1 hypothetical protein GCM10010932_11470 [Agromyces flavus]SDT40068.1 hypothetical protein SAMN04489721_3471 [Agromyces flavus]